MLNMDRHKLIILNNDGYLSSKLKHNVCPLWHTKDFSDLPLISRLTKSLDGFPKKPFKIRVENTNDTTDSCPWYRSRSQDHFFSTCSQSRVGIERFFSSTRPQIKRTLLRVQSGPRRPLTDSKSSGLDSRPAAKMTFWKCARKKKSYWIWTIIFFTWIKKLNLDTETIKGD